MQPYLEVISLSKNYDKKAVISNINFSVKKGSFTVLLGPSGCGKTTILRIIAGLEKPTNGKIFINGRNITDEPPFKRKFSMVFQSYALFPHLSIKENIIFGLKIRKIKKNIIREKLNQAAELLNLTEVLDKKPGQLSGGQKQRVALARAFVSGHLFCLMDEPLSNLDAKLRHKMRIEIKRLQKKLGITVLYVTHDQIEAMSMADHIILLNNGKIEQQGTPQSLYQKPETIFAGKFIGTPSMNIVRLNKKKETICINKKIINDVNLLSVFEQIEDGEYYLGIRPEDVIINKEKGGIKGIVLFQDYLGADLILSLQISDDLTQEPFLVRVKVQDSFFINKEVYLVWNEEKITIFDLNGQRIKL
jgi:ABC-type sugar transport system ATPase subunit